MVWPREDITGQVLKEIRLRRIKLKRKRILR
jgi:hypothetical protein